MNCKSRKLIIALSIRQLRKEQHLSVDLLSAISDIPKLVIVALENGEIFPCWEIVTKLASAFDCSYMRILFREEEYREAISF